MNLTTIRDITRAKKYPHGSVIIEEGSYNDLYILLAGEASVFYKDRSGNIQLTYTIGPGNLLGQEAFFAGSKSTYSATATKDIIAIPVSKLTIVNFIRDEPEIAFEIMKTLNSSNNNSAFHSAMQEVHMNSADGNQGSLSLSLFPDGHGAYELLLNNDDRDHLMEKKIECPVCKQSFMTLSVKPSKLILEKADSDMRNYYTGVEPLYYDVLTCPYCLYSALTDMFKSPDKSRTDIQEALKPFKADIIIKSGTERDTYSIFAGYYLALQCAPISFINHEMATAKLLLKLSRVYQDCKDSVMESTTLKKALDAYLHVYEKVNLTPAQEQQLCIIVGEIYFKLKETDNAKNFFFKAKTNREGTPVLRDQADNRLFEIREIEKI